MSARSLEQLEDLAGLEYAVARQGMSKAQALKEARRLQIPAHLCDAFVREPGTYGVTTVRGTAVRVSAAADEPTPATHTNAKLRCLPFAAELRRPALTHEAAEALCRDFSRKLGFPIRLDWATNQTRIEVDHQHATEIVVPGGMVREASMTAELLALTVAHEFGHVHLVTRDEASVDYWAARHGLRLLWSAATPDAFFRKGFLTAYALVAYLGNDTVEPLTLLTGDSPQVTLLASGYPNLQSRWELLKAGLLARPMPPLAVTVTDDPWRANF